ncbi:adhesion G protein-coupled receptor E3 [Sceloporus undulatus]|uniref:adhesion G protein-coupled receptor E3 n=1 Tax=Sceloporus undulatus TaxID=8520 RepID=UPI001C4CC78E|nr:adhesion G protein-coupled receptor E3 [Sceloporus undulatus]
MRSTLSCLILGLGFVIIYADGKFTGGTQTGTSSHLHPTYHTWRKFQVHPRIPKRHPTLYRTSGSRKSDMKDTLIPPLAEPEYPFAKITEQPPAKRPSTQQLSTDFFSDNEDHGFSGNVGDDGIFCGRNAIPFNKSTCICEKGYKKVLWEVTVNGGYDFRCEKIPHHCQSNILWENDNVKMCLNTMKSDNLNNVNSSYCAFIENIRKSACDNNSSATISLEDKAETFEKQINSSLQGIKAKGDRISAVTFALELLGSTAASTALLSPTEQPQAVVVNSIVIQTNLISEESISENKVFRLEAEGDQMSIHPRAVADDAIKGPIAVAFISYGGLGSLQTEGTFLQNETLPSNEVLENIHVNSRVVRASTSSLMRNISSPVNLTFNHLKDKLPQEKVICVHWNSASRSHTWSPEGCQYVYSNATHSECSCQYLSNFAVLMATAPTQGDLILFMISYVGLIISVICLFLSIVTFFLCRSVQNRSTFIHLQLSLCLFFADLLFIIGIDKTYNKILCSVIAGMLQYLFLACFLWMFLEGVNLYLIVRNLKVANYSGASKRMKLSMYFCGYGLPAVIVAISAATVPEGYGTHKHCWLHIEKGFIWSFMGPVCAIIVINLVLFCLILMNLHKKVASLNTEVTTLRNTRSLILKAVAHVFILGVTWCLGLFQYGPLATVMAYLFTITNSVQGIFIFLVHCLFNKKVRETYQRWICCRREIKLPISDVTWSTVPITGPMKNEQGASASLQQSVEWGKEP